jgi:hypothetical protein
MHNVKSKGDWNEYAVACVDPTTITITIKRARIEDATTFTITKAVKDNIESSNRCYAIQIGTRKDSFLSPSTFGLHWAMLQVKYTIF